MSKLLAAFALVPLAWSAAFAASGWEQSQSALADARRRYAAADGACKKASDAVKAASKNPMRRAAAVAEQKDKCDARGMAEVRLKTACTRAEGLAEGDKKHEALVAKDCDGVLEKKKD